MRRVPGDKMLLKDEEMKLLCNYPFNQSKGCYVCVEAVAKAQLKKVVEKLLPCQGLKRDDLDDRVYMLLTIAVDDWQTIIQEVK